MGDRPLLPCPACGAEAWGGEDTQVTETIENGFVFGGKPEQRIYPGTVCPACGHEFAI